MNDPYSPASPEDDDLGTIDVYKTEDEDEDEKEDASGEDGDQDEDKRSFSPTTAGITNTDDIAVTSVVQTHLQRLYIDQQRERHTRMNKSNQHRQQLLQEVRSLRKTSKEQAVVPTRKPSESIDSRGGSEALSEETPTSGTSKVSATTRADSLKKPPDEVVDRAHKETASPEVEPAGAVAEVTTKNTSTASSSATGSMRSSREEAVYEEAKIVAFPATFAKDASGSMVRTGAATVAGDLGVAKPQSEAVIGATQQGKDIIGHDPGLCKSQFWWKADFSIVFPVQWSFDPSVVHCQKYMKGTRNGFLSSYAKTIGIPAEYQKIIEPGPAKICL